VCCDVSVVQCYHTLYSSIVFVGKWAFIEICLRYTRSGRDRVFHCCPLSLVPCGLLCYYTRHCAHLNIHLITIDANRNLSTQPSFRSSHNNINHRFYQLCNVNCPLLILFSSSAVVPRSLKLFILIVTSHRLID